ncbi:receptor-like protein 7 [Lotus japonicus]|uniref:receptor-like protein 7 n=1 Tax=Lotus japonicus TaxID=34305 RepID=UPI002586947D|nr:receptor-like protein 7 [Lotus japonicus]
MGWIPLPYFIFHSFLLLLLHFPSYTCSLCNYHDNSALLQFKNSFVVNTSADNFMVRTHCSSFSTKTETWKNGTDCCSKWDGVTCDALSGHVIGLDLSCGHLHGEFQPNSTIFQLRHLQQLNLAFNHFWRSPLYPGIGDLVELTHLNLSYSGIIGNIPSTISHLSELVSLDLSNSYMRFDPSTWKKLILNTTNLRELHLDGTDMSSVRVSSLMNLSSSLVSLHLQYTGLQGNFPSDIFCLPNLEELDLSLNDQLMGQIPKSNCSTPLRYLDLSSTSFSGEIPDSIGHLKSLEILDLHSSKFNGVVPLSLWNLTRLTSLSLSYNHFRGEIPPLLSNLKHLTNFEIRYNNFSGCIPEQLGELLKLEFLQLSMNNLRGPIPSKMAGLPKLEFLDLSSNMLTGTIPHWCYSLPFLSSLDLSNNHLMGKIGEFSTYALEDLNLSNNKLQGQIPHSVFEFENLTDLDFSSNDLSVYVDFHQFSKLKSLTSLNLSQINFLAISFDSTNDYELPNLQSLYLSSCNIESSFPKFLAPLQNLEELDLSNNKIHGQIPKWFHEKLLHSWKNIEYIDLSFNQLQGDLPIPPKSIYNFLVSNNHFTGYIDSMICNASSLIVLNLAHNNLTGTIPQCLGTFYDLVVLDLQMNNLHGSIPINFSEGNVFETIKLNDNRLEGPLPQALAKCTKLEVLDLGDNNIEDSFPSWLETLQELQVLRLRSNKFRGIITCSNTKHPFPKLRIIDVANNNFSGSLPALCFMKFQGMMNVSNNPNRSLYMNDKGYYKDSVVIIMKGQEVELKRILTAFTTIDLSNNMFEGCIPKVIGRLKSLIGLNLSHNRINGVIPHSLSNLTNLEWLDLSWNQLTSDIPLALTNLNFLSTLNLSQNHLEGIIPTGGQFNTYGNASYGGNPMLCGFPLSKSCNKDEEQPPHSTFQDDEESGFGWKSVAVGYACGAVFGMLLGYNLFLTTKPQWLATLVEGLLGVRVKRTNNRARTNRR